MIRQLIALALALAGMRQLDRVPHGVVGSGQVRPIISSHDWRSLTGIGLFVPKPSHCADCQRCGVPDLGTAVRQRLLASTSVGGDCYSLGYPVVRESVSRAAA